MMTSSCYGVFLLQTGLRDVQRPFRITRDGGIAAQNPAQNPTLNSKAAESRAAKTAANRGCYSTCDLYRSSDSPTVSSVTARCVDARRRGRKAALKRQS